MRWSLLRLCTFLAAFSALEGVLCAPIDTVELERRVVSKPKKAKAAAPKGALTPGKFKKSSAAYRKAALKNPFMYQVSGGTVIQVKTPKTPPKGMDADHIVEAQTAASALKKGGITTTSALGKKGLEAAKEVINHPNNVAFVTGSVNKSKGQVHKFALKGGNPNVNPKVKAYLKRTAPQSKQVAKDIDLALKKSGINGVSVEKEHNMVLAKAGIKRRQYILDELD